MVNKDTGLTELEKEKMKSGIYMVNNFIMNMIGIKPDRNGFLSLVSGEKLQVKGRSIKLFNIESQDIPFRPVYNAKMMLLIFGLYVSKLQAEDGRYIKSIAYGNANKKDKNYIEVEEEDCDVVKSEEYYADSLRYVDAICQLSEVDPPLDLQELDALMRRK